ncbi:MAG: glycerate kinase [Eubacteriales bacterium]|nr:glycerate kinase [Eubacteriales bacterium]
MSVSLRNDAEKIINTAISAVKPDTAVKKALTKIIPELNGSGRIILIAVGKASWQMANAANDLLKERISVGAVITKHGHSLGQIGELEIYEAGHPVPDENSFRATDRVIELVSGLNAEDSVLFLVSGGGSALFEKPMIPAQELKDITDQLLGCGADIREINTIRKRLSAVKGGKFARLCSPAKVYSVILSDIIGDPLDMIASGPAHPDSSTSAQAIGIVEKYGLSVSEKAMALIKTETPKELPFVETFIAGNVVQLCEAAAKKAEELGYETQILTSCLSCTARDAGVFLANIARQYRETDHSLAFICGGETVVKLTGNGLGGRNQELALAAADGISGLCNAALFSVGSDGTDGPTDAAGGYVDGDTKSALLERNIDIYSVLEQNDSYHALERAGGLIFTGPTGTNVNDLNVLLIKV